MTEIDYKALRAKTTARRGRRFDPETAKVRRADQNRRTSVMQARALIALSHLHPDDYRSLYEQARAEVDAERGPLPGDES